MTPVSPVCDTIELTEVVFAKNQPEYQPLPAYRSEGGLVLTRWRLTWRERLDILFGGCLWLQMLTFNKPLTPVKITTTFPLADVVDRNYRGPIGSAR